MRVALAQIGPVLLDRGATLERGVRAIEEAAAGGASLVAFGEVFLPGYPIWLDRTGGAKFDDRLQKELHAEYLASTVDIEAGEMDPILEAAKRSKIAVVIGIAERARERAGHTIFASCVTVSPAGEVVSVHRKLMPTYEERLCWGTGDAHGLVVHRFGELSPFTLGSLNCWENWMPLPRAALHAQGEDLHVAIWPGGDVNTRDITPVIAKEGRSFVISVGARLTHDDIPANFPARDEIVSSAREAGKNGLIHNGGSCVAGPDGSWVLEPDTETDGVLFAEIDHARVLEERQNFDPSGHYARPELLRLEVDRRRVRSAVFRDE
ncbi:MAG: carbon-nitrogen hydrolase family protein [Planctomycetota bacterium]